MSLNWERKGKYYSEAGVWTICAVMIRDELTYELWTGHRTTAKCVERSTDVNLLKLMAEELEFDLVQREQIATAAGPMSGAQRNMFEEVR